VKGALSQSREKIKDFQFCLPILPIGEIVRLEISREDTQVGLADRIGNL
jgi:hypothetical protein